MWVNGLKEKNTRNTKPLQQAESMQILIFMTSLRPPVETSCF